MPGKQTTAPDVLPAGAKSVWRSAFNSALEQHEGDESRAAKIAWGAVKRQYRKNKEGEWVEKSFEDFDIVVDGIPLPGSLAQSPISAALTWVDAFKEDYSESGNMAEAATAGWAALKERYSQEESGLWILRPKHMESSHEDEEEEDEDEEREVERARNKKFFSAEERRKLAEKKQAMPDGSFPIRNRQDLEDAIQSIGRAKEGRRAAVRKHIIKRAKALGLISALPEDWKISKSLDFMKFRHAPGPNYSGNEAFIDLDGLTEEQEELLIESGYGNSQAVCPCEMEPMQWSDLPARYRTVESVINAKRQSRAYHAAVERLKEDHGFVARVGPNNDDELILSGPTQIGEDSDTFEVSGVLTRRASSSGFDPEDWTFRGLARGGLSSVNVRVPSDEIRFHGPALR